MEKNGKKREISGKKSKKKRKKLQFSLRKPCQCQPVMERSYVQDRRLLSSIHCVISHSSKKKYKNKNLLFFTAKTLRKKLACHGEVLSLSTRLSPFPDPAKTSFFCSFRYFFSRGICTVLQYLPHLSLTYSYYTLNLLV